MGLITGMQSKINREEQTYLPEYIKLGEAINIIPSNKVDSVYMEYLMPNMAKVKVCIATKSQEEKNAISFKEIIHLLEKCIQGQQCKFDKEMQMKEYRKTRDILNQNGYEITMIGNAILRFQGNEPLNLNGDLINGEDVIDFLSVKEEIRVERIKEIIRKKYKFEIGEWQGLEGIIDTLNGFIPRYRMSISVYQIFGKITDASFTELITEKENIFTEKYTDEEVKTVMQYFKNRKRLLEDLSGKDYKSEKLDNYHDQRIEEPQTGESFVETISQEKLTEDQLNQNPAFEQLNRMSAPKLYERLTHEIEKQRAQVIEKSKEVANTTDQER